MTDFPDVQALASRSAVFRFVRAIADGFGAAVRRSRARAIVSSRILDFRRLDAASRLRVVVLFLVTFAAGHLALFATMPAGSAPSLPLAAWFLFLALGVALVPLRRYTK